MLSITAEYALRIMVVVAEAGDKPTTSERIAELTNVPPDYSVKVLQMLARAGLVRAQRGRGGGFRLECDPAVTSLLEIIQAIEPLATPKRPRVRARKNSDGRGNLAPLYRRLDETMDLFREGLLHTTLANVTKPEVEAGTQATPTQVTPA